MHLTKYFLWIRRSIKKLIFLFELKSFFYCDHFRSWTIFYHFKIRTFFFYHDDKFIDLEIIIFVIRSSKKFFLYFKKCFFVQFFDNVVFFKRFLDGNKLTERIKIAWRKELRFFNILFNGKFFKSQMFSICKTDDTFIAFFIEIYFISFWFDNNIIMNI